MNSPPASEPLTASMFISLQDAEKAATSKPTMWVMTPDGKSTMEIPMPASVTESGKVPVGFSIDWALDPHIVISGLASIGITTTGQLPPEVFENLKAEMNAPDNLLICPTFVFEEKRARTLKALKFDANKQETEHVSGM